MRIVLFIMYFVLASLVTEAQPVCTFPAQTPSTAITICSNGTYARSPSMNCYNSGFYLPGCTNENTSYGDIHPTYYKFTCKTAGTFGFTIAAWKPEDDMNWQLFDITGRNPNDIYTDRTLTVAANWSGTPGPTGASSQGSILIQCRTLAGPVNPANTFCRMPVLKENHTYLLMVSNLSGAGAFSLTVENGSADISGDITAPLKAETATCNNQELVLVFSNPVKCSSITSTGSEFSLQPNHAAVYNVLMSNCNTSGETDSITLRFSQPLSNGSYTLNIRNGTDGNTIEDKCGNLIPVNTEIKFTISPFPVVDSVVIAACQPSKIKLLLSKQTLCSSIATDGSDFEITGPSQVSISSVNSICKNGTANEIELVLQNPITADGSYTIQLKNGNDGNTISDQCNNTTPTGSLKNFAIKGAVTANFTFTIAKGCIADTLKFMHPGNYGVNQWNWSFSNNTRSSLQQPEMTFTQSGTQKAILYVSNGQCSATAEESFTLDEKLKADFELPASACSNQLITIVDKSKAAVSYNWNFGNGTSSSQLTPPPQTYITSTDKDFPVILTVQKNECISSTAKSILIKANCIIHLPNAFTPNGDGLNDLFGPFSSQRSSIHHFRVFNRYGQLLFEATPNGSLWNGTFKGVQQPAGSYLWMMEYMDPYSNKTISQRGTVHLIR